VAFLLLGDFFEHFIFMLFIYLFIGMPEECSSPHQGNPDQRTPAAAVRQSWSDAAPAPSPQAMRQQGVNDAKRLASGATVLLR